MDNEVEELSIDKDKIIQILLKHLMNVQNEFVYFKNKTGLNTNDYNDADQSKGIINKGDDATLKGIGIIGAGDDVTLQGIGTIGAGDDVTLQGIGTIGAGDDATLQGIGIIGAGDDATLQGIGIIGAGDDATLQRLSINHLVQALLNISGKANADDLLHTVFEQKLTIALTQYTQFGNGQNTLYNFYSDFTKAVLKSNDAVLKLKEATTNLRLEDTHNMPAKIPYQDPWLTLLEVALRGHIPASSKQKAYETIAYEIVFIQNEGILKQADIREATGMSVSGFSKHLPKLIEYNLIKEMPGKKYDLSEKSKRLLLELFGVPKTK